MNNDQDKEIKFNNLYQLLKENNDDETFFDYDAEIFTDENNQIDKDITTNVDNILESSTLNNSPFHNDTNKDNDFESEKINIDNSFNNNINKEDSNNAVDLENSEVIGTEDNDDKFNNLVDNSINSSVFDNNKNNDDVIINLDNENIKDDNLEFDKVDIDNTFNNSINEEDNNNAVDLENPVVIEKDADKSNKLVDNIFDSNISKLENTVVNLDNDNNKDDNLESEKINIANTINNSINEEDNNNAVDLENTVVIEADTDKSNNLTENDSVHEIDNNTNEENISVKDDIIVPQELVTTKIINDKQEDNKIDNYDKNRVDEIKKKGNNKKEIVYDDGIDTTDYGKGNILSILINRKFLLFVMAFAFVFVCIVVAKAFYFGKKIDTYEEYFAVISEKEEEEAKAFDDKEIDNEVLKKVAASELISCINSKIDADKLPDSIKSIINEINSYYNQSYNHFAFLYKDIFSGFTVSYNANQNIFTASTIKAPADLYIYEMASQGKVNLDEELTYTGAYYNTGTGVLKNKKTNTKYSVRTLLEYSIVYSDNAAHNMLMDKYGRDNMRKFWQEKGTTAIFTANNNWGIVNANDASIYMEELYKFYINNSEYGEAIMNNFINAKTKFIKGKNNYVVANKSGWSGTAIHDVSIVFADNPYIVVALSNLGNTDYYMNYFNKVNDLAYKLHTEYWKYKMEMCGSIKQY